MVSSDFNYKPLVEALRRRQQVIADHSLRDQNAQLHLEQLKAAYTQLEQQIENLPKPLNPELAHYLQKQSFEKALHWLEENACSSNVN